ncbi:L-seryl-tRNA(Sec) selenium transferase [Deltaproteobacteria bacterium]|nr:L-seryl-tRNA(Sec) selenium transferase [Deltaproteobacteria bacterium]
MQTRRHLPAIGTLVTALGDLPRPLVVSEARALVESVRSGTASAPADWAEAVRARVNTRLAPVLRPVINATGVVLHTNLGRAPLGDRAQRRLHAVASGWCNLELHLETGERGERLTGVEQRLRSLVGAEAALAVNNNAAAVLLVLTALAAGREVIVSRGELVEIGGSFRVPEVIAAGGARLVEVGTTNRTRVRDFAGAIGTQTGAILRVHPSNFRVSGFTESPDRAALRALATAANVPLIEDLGSGALAAGLGEPTVADALATTDLVCFSGDKLLGGPQAGLVVGRADLVQRARKHPLYRALRLDRLVLAALEGTLIDYEAGAEPPAVAMLRLDAASLRPRAEALASRLQELGWAATALATIGRAGGGSLPELDLPGWGVALTVEGTDAFLTRLRVGTPAVLARAADGQVLLDLRTVPAGEENALLAALAAARA